MGLIHKQHGVKMRKVCLSLALVLIFLGAVLVVRSLPKDPFSSAQQEKLSQIETKLIHIKVSDTPTTTSTPNFTPTVKTNTPAPTQTNVPTLTPTLRYNPVTPMEFVDENGNRINFGENQNLTVSFEGNSIDTYINLNNPSIPLEEQLGSCHSSFSLLAFNALEGNSLVPYKTAIIGHSGHCLNGHETPLELIRYWLEGNFWDPDTQQRVTQLQKIIGEKICFNQACFKISEAVYVDKRKLESSEYVPGDYSKFFAGGELPSQPEIFLSFCGSEGTDPSDWFSAKYVLRLAIP